VSPAAVSNRVRLRGDCGPGLIVRHAGDGPGMAVRCEVPRTILIRSQQGGYVFNRKFKLFKWMGFEVGIDPSWIVLAVLVAWSLSAGYFPALYKQFDTATYWIMGIVGAFGLFLSIVVHEFCHSLLAKRSGVEMKGITLFIFGGVAEMGGEPPSARDEFLIAAAGPLSSFVVAALFYGLGRFGTAVQWPQAIGGVLHYLGMINLVLAIFNLIPAFPLDGGRMLRALLWRWKKDLRLATRTASQIGVGFAYFLIFIAVLRVLGGNFIGGMWMFLIGLFLLNAARMSYQQLMVRRALEGESLKRFMTDRPVTVPSELTLDRVVEDYVYEHHHKMFPVMDNGNLAGCITAAHIKSVAREQWPQKRVADIAESCSDENTISPDADAVEALAQMRRNDTGRLMVVQDHKLVGIVALKDMLSFLSMKIELEQRDS